MTERLKRWERADSRNMAASAVAKNQSRHGTQVAKAKDRILGRAAGPRVDAVTQARAKGKSKP